jgi:hypothetical protein
MVQMRVHARKHSVGTPSELTALHESGGWSPRDSSISVTIEPSPATSLPLHQSSVGGGSGSEIRRGVLRRPDKLPLASGKTTRKFNLRRRVDNAVGIADIAGLGHVLPLTADLALTEGGNTSSPTLTELAIADELKAKTPRCWRTLYDLVNFYSTMPDTMNAAKSAASKLSVIEEEPEKLSVVDEGDEDCFAVRDEVDAEAIERQPEQLSSTRKKPEKTRETYILKNRKWNND